MIDLLLKNGLIYDGNGTSPILGDVSVLHGKIQAIEPGIAEEAAETVDVSGLAIAPGFLDIHSRSDASFLLDERCTSKVLQGVTTEVVGQDGESPFPRSVSQVSRVRREEQAGQLSGAAAYQAGSFEKLRRKSEGYPMTTNLLQLVGQNAMRRGVVGPVERAAWDDEIKIAHFLLDQSITQGSWGMSFALDRYPGALADEAELIDLMEMCYIFDQLVTVRLRDSGVGIFDALDEIFDLARKTKAKMHITGLRLTDPRMRGKAAQVWEKIKQAREEGLSITADCSPQPDYCDDLLSCLPADARAHETRKLVQLLSQPGEERDRILSALAESCGTGAEGERILLTAAPSCEELEGKTFAQIAKEQGCSIPEAIADVLVRTKCTAVARFSTVEAADALYFLRQDGVLAGTGTASAMPDHSGFESESPAILDYWKLMRKENCCTTEELIHRLTGQPAALAGLKDRGILQPDAAADLTIFDPESGIRHVLINGVFVVRDGVQTEARPGQYLLKPEY